MDISWSEMTVPLQRNLARHYLCRSIAPGAECTELFHIFLIWLTPWKFTIIPLSSIPSITLCFPLFLDPHWHCPIPQFTWLACCVQAILRKWSSEKSSVPPVRSGNSKAASVTPSDPGTGHRRNLTLAQEPTRADVWARLYQAPRTHLFQLGAKLSGACKQACFPCSLHMGLNSRCISILFWAALWGKDPKGMKD